jgi:Acetyltransferase (GNAT) family
MNITVRPARPEDLEAVVGVHLRAFRGFFLSTLGRRFLLGPYRSSLANADGRLLVAEADGEIAGFATGSLAPKRLFRRLVMSRWYAFGWAAVGALAQRPHAVLPQLLAAARYRGEAARQGRRFVYLTTDRDGNESSQLFYVRHGFDAESSIHRRDGRVMMRYARALDHAS